MLYNDNIGFTRLNLALGLFVGRMDGANKVIRSGSWPVRAAEQATRNNAGLNLRRAFEYI